MNNLYLLILALGTGAGVAIMTVINARLGGILGGPFWAAATLFSVALTVVVLIATVTQPGPITTGIAAAPWWVWTGGLFSATFIVVSTFLAPRLGVALTLASTIVGQLSAALIVDHFGLFGAPVIRASFLRVFGVGLLLAGIVLLRWKP